MNPFRIILALIVAGIALNYLLCGTARPSPEHILGAVVKDPVKIAGQVTNFVNEQVQQANVHVATTYLKLKAALGL